MSEFYYPLECGWDIVPGAMALVSNTWPFFAVNDPLRGGIRPSDLPMGWTCHLWWGTIGYHNTFIGESTWTPGRSPDIPPQPTHASLNGVKVQHCHLESSMGRDELRTRLAKRRNKNVSNMQNSRNSWCATNLV